MLSLSTYAFKGPVIKSYDSDHGTESDWQSENDH